MKLGDRLRLKSADFRRRLGDEIRAADAAGLDLMHYRYRERLAARGLPWTRENHIREAWGGEPPSPEDWVANDHESDLPEHLRDYSKGGP
jgi:hypothetical protein